MDLWRSRSSKRCLVSRVTGGFRVVAKARGVCRLQVKVAATDELAALKRKYRVRVTGR